MGRPFADELFELEETHRRAVEAPIESLVENIGRLYGKPLLAVGSGGSLTTAAVAATLFRDLAFGISAAITPLELSAKRSSLRQSSVLIATAGGSNPDVIGILRTAAQAEAAIVLAICAKVGTKLSVEGSKFSNVVIEEFGWVPNGDGFLATNSLWASSILLFRAFASAASLASQIPNTLHRLVDAQSWKVFVDATVVNASSLWERKTTVVLYGPSSYPAAVDLESKLTEAALSNVWIADYRHFAHGRHHWFAKRADDSSVIAFVSDADVQLAERTLGELPHSVPQLRIGLADDPTAILTALAHVFPIALSAGLACGIDPGRPSVPSFGRRIYRLNAYGKIAPRQNLVPSTESVVIERKAGAPMLTLERRGLEPQWRDAYVQFVERLRSAQFEAIVFDYDGTLCGRSDRFGSLRKTVSAELTRLLRAGLEIGIATGRGKSVRESMRESIAKKYWSQVTVGYYNGGQIGELKNDDFPDGRSNVANILVPVLDALNANKRLKEIATIEGRLGQITITSSNPALVEECWAAALHSANLAAPGLVKLVRSSHSFDLLPSDVSKLDVIKHLQRKGRNAILAIGDMGRWPGNDCELLSHPYSLSVDQVSPDRETCWNLSPPGISGVDATLRYLAAMAVNTKGRMRFRSLKQLKG